MSTGSLDRIFPRSPTLRSVLVAVFLFGLVLQGLLWSRQAISYDAKAILHYALEFGQADDLPGFSKPISGGGRLPGFALPGLVWTALKVWPDYRSPGVLTGLTHILAMLLLVGVIARYGGWTVACWYVAFYWLSVWRLFHAGVLWEPAFMFLPAALHLWLCSRLHERPSPIASMALPFLLAVAFQLHAAAMILFLATIVLGIRRQLRIRMAYFTMGVLAGIAMYIPTLRDLLAGSEAPPFPTQHHGFLGAILSAAKGLAYWFRLGAPDLGRRFRETHFAEGSAGDMISSILLVAGTACVAITIWASWRYFRRSGADPADQPSSRWLREYAWATLIGLILAAGLSPVSIQTWHAVTALHAACIPLATWFGTCQISRPRLRRALGIGLVGLHVTAALVLTLGHKRYASPDRRWLEQEHFAPAIRELVPGDRPGE